MSIIRLRRFATRASLVYPCLGPRLYIPPQGWFAVGMCHDQRQSFPMPDWFMPSNVCQISNYISCGKWLICAFIVLFLFCVYFCISCSVFFTVPLVISWCYRDAVYSVFYFFLLFLLCTLYLCTISYRPIRVKLAKHCWFKQYSVLLSRQSWLRRCD